MKHINPYSDDVLTYNEQLHTYELTRQWILDNFGNPFRDDGVLNARIKRNTRKVYNYIFNIAYSGNRKIITAIINHTEEYREWIRDCLMAQMEADLSSGFNDNTLFNSKSVEERMLKQIDEICIDCEHIVYSAAGYGGINLICATALPNIVYLEFMGYCK